MQKALLLDGGHHVTNSALMGSQGPREARDIAGPGDRVGKPERGQPVNECVCVSACVCACVRQRDHPLSHTDVPGEFALPGRCGEL